MHMAPIALQKLTPGILACLVAVLAWSVAAAGQTQSGTSRAGARTASRSDVVSLLNAWTPGPRLAGQEMIAKYGLPQEITSERMIWRNAGPFKRIMLTREELPHDFPITHVDYLEHTISYNVPPDKTDDLHAFDASMTIYRVAGELSARCDLESNNVLTLNLANDVATGKKSVDEARREFGQAVTERTLGKPPASTMALQFQPATPQAAADREKTTIPGSPQRATMNRDASAKSPNSAVGTSGSARADSGSDDAEILALLIALDENEVHAAMAAQEKKVTGALLAYARLLHQQHGAHIQDTQQLGITIGVTPMETAAVDQLHNNGAEQLAKLIPLSGPQFERAFAAAMATSHREALQMLDRLQTQARRPELKQHLTATRQRIDMHLKEAEQLRR